VTSPPVHIHAVAVLADGGVLSWELAAAEQDQASIHFERGADEEPGGERTGAHEELTFRVQHRPPLDRPGGLFRTGTFGGAVPTGKEPGRDVPDYVVAMIAQAIGWQPGGGLTPGTPAYASAVRGQAGIIAQRIWSEAFLAGIAAAERLGMIRSKVMLGDPQPQMMPLFSVHGEPNWVPPRCPHDGCGAPVSTIEPFLTAMSDGKGNREVVARPCDHVVWVPDPVKVTFT
jgi:hypothetical protein